MRLMANRQHLPFRIIYWAWYSQATPTFSADASRRLILPDIFGLLTAKPKWPILDSPFGWWAWHPGNPGTGRKTGWAWWPGLNSNFSELPCRFRAKRRSGQSKKSVQLITPPNLRPDRAEQFQVAQHPKMRSDRGSSGTTAGRPVVQH